MPASNAPFPIQPDLTAIAVMYKNRAMIADKVAPRVPVAKQEFKYIKHDMAEGFTVPDTRVGRKSAPNNMEFTAVELTDSTQDYGLQDAIPQADMDNAPPNYNPLNVATQQLTNLIELDREVRTAGLVFNPASYATANKQTLATTAQFSDYANSDPLGVIMAALDSMVMRANRMVIGRAAFTKLAMHPKIVKASFGNAGDSGIATREFIARLFELDEVIVGESFINTSKKGQTPTLARAWGKHIALLNIDNLADVNSGTSFALTAQFGGRIAGSIPDGDIGLRGGQRLRVGESVKELITAPDFGYFIQNAVA